MSAVERKASEWAEDAAVLRRRGCDREAEIWERAAAELRSALRDDDDALLTQAEAAAESGYTTRRLRQLDLPNHGRTGSPRYRRGDLPRKAASRSDESAERLAAGILESLR
jgi:hypothetical protein